MKKHFQKIAAAVTAMAMTAMIFTGSALTVNADYIDGDTPEDYTNRVTTSFDEIIWPTVITNFHAPSMKALVPTSPKAAIDTITGVDVSHYADAKTYVYVGENNEYGDLAKAAINSAIKNVNGTRIATATINLFKYEGKAYKMIEETDANIEFMVSIPKSVRATGRDYAMLRLNADGTVSYLTDLDDDRITVTFETNYFKADSLYCLVYGPKGAFDAYKPVEPAAAN